MKIVVKTIDHRRQRYETWGDWTIDRRGNIEIRVSRMGDWCREAAIAIHEIVEAVLCRHAGVTQEAVDEFDMNYRGPGEPGEDRHAPYFDQHLFADLVEKLVAQRLGLDWRSHSGSEPQ